MTTYNTGNALGSSDARDLYDNAENIDNFANGSSNTYQDRLGVTRKSLAGMNAAFDDFIESSGYTVPVAYTSGIVLSAYNQLVEYNDEFYKLKAGQAPYTTTGTWGADSAKLVAVGDAALRQELAAGDGASKIGYQLAGGVVRDVADKLGEFISANDSGAIGNDIADDTIKLQALFDAGAGKLVKLRPGAVYRCTAGLTVKGDVDGQGATLKFYGTTIPYLVSQHVEGSLKNFTIDGANVTSCRNGLFVDTDFVQKATCYYDLVVKNISNSNNTQDANGALFYKSSSASVNLNSQLNIKINVENVTATANGVEGDTGGKASGILVSFNVNGTDGHVSIHDCRVVGVSSGGVAPEEDSDGIHVYQNDFTSDAAKGKWEIKNCYVQNARKRGFKVQAPNATIFDCTADGTTLAGFETYAIRTNFDSCRARVSRIAFSTSHQFTAFSNCNGRGLATDQPVVAIYETSDKTTISDSVFVAAGTRVSEYVGVIRFYSGGTGSSTVLDNVRLTCGTNTGSGIYINGGPHYVTARGLSVDGMHTGVFMYQADGSLNVVDSSFAVTGGGIVLVTNAAPKPTITLKNIIGSGGNINAGDSVLTLENSVISKFGGGACVFTTAAGSRVIDSVINADNSTDGINIGNSVVRGNRINSPKIGVVFDYTTTAEVSLNVAVGAVTPYSKTGYTPFVDHDNYSR